MIAQQKKEFDQTIAQQQSEIETLAATVKEQAAQIQKVSAQVSITQSARRLAIDNQSPNHRLYIHNKKTNHQRKESSHEESDPTHNCIYYC
jgi:hypothetical protein